MYMYIYIYAYSSRLYPVLGLKIINKYSWSVKGINNEFP